MALLPAATESRNDAAPVAEAAHSLLAAGFSHHRAGRYADAEEVYRAVLNLVPDDGEALHLLALLLRQKGEPLAAAECLRRLINARPDFVEAYNSLGNLLHGLGRVEEATACYNQALALQPDYPEARYNLGNLLATTGQPEAAKDAYEAAIKVRPGFAEALAGLGQLAHAAGRFEEAARFYTAAVTAKPDFAAAHNALGIALQKLGRLQEAIKSYDDAIAADPGYAAAYSNRSTALTGLGRLDQARASAEAAIAHDPDSADAENNFAHVLQRLGRSPEAIQHYRRALRLNPTFAEAHSNLIHALDFDPAADMAAQQAERRAWDESFGRPAMPAEVHFANSRELGRRLRIGYVSADFREHSAAFAFAAPLLNHDHGGFEVFCYSGVAHEDGWTARFRRAADHWRDTRDLDDDALAAQIRADNIDILVDLSGHTAGNRLKTFARRPAPVSLSAFGHITGTGLAAMDYVLADPVLIPPESRGLLAEEVLDLPCAIPFYGIGQLPAVGLLPGKATGRTTFGCLNRLGKLTPGVIELWAAILDDVPDSRLLLKARELSEAAVRADYARRFAAHDIAAERLIFRGKSTRLAHLKTYHEIDIALDPWPHGGGVTTFESLAMGVPVITLKGRTPAERLGTAILSHLELETFIADDLEDYRSLAKARAESKAPLALLRAALRPRIEASVAGDPGQYARAVEAAYRAIWRRWCEAA